jgi:hypothetical protein
MSAFRVVQALTAYQGLPLVQKFLFDETDPTAPQYTRPLDLTGRTLAAQLRGRPKVKVKKLEVLEDPPAPGVYQFKVTLGGAEYPFSITIEVGDTAIDFIEKFLDAIGDLDLEVKACAETCGTEGEVIIAWPWPGVEWDLVLVSQPEPDQIEVDNVQAADVVLATFAVTTATEGDYTAITLKLTGTQTGALPMAGDGPFSYRLTATDDGDATDVLLLARGHLLIGRV